MSQIELVDDVSDLAPEYAWLDGGQAYVVCAFYTPSYLRHVLGLKRSVEALRINHFFKRYEPASSWQAGTRLKPRFIADCLAKFEAKHILYVDADAAIQQPLSALDEVATDIAFCFRMKEDRLRIGAGAIYIRNTPGGRRFVETWRSQEQVCGPFATDSELLPRTLVESSNLSISLLPRGYRTSGPEAVIEQFSVSTRRRRRERKQWRRIAVAAVMVVSVAVVLGGLYLIFAR